jgi:hypothetical protein
VNERLLWETCEAVVLAGGLARSTPQYLELINMSRRKNP